MMFAGVVVYLIGAGAIGELQLLQVQAQTRVVTQQLSQVQKNNRALQAKIRYLHSTAGQRAAVRSALHYAQPGSVPLLVKSAP